LLSIDFSNDSTGHIVGNWGTILRKTSASTWNTEISSSTENLRSVKFISPYLGLAVGNDGTILKYNDLVTVGQIEVEGIETNNLKFYPNPFSNHINFEFELKEPSNTKLEIFDITGKLIKTIVNTKLPSQKHQFSFTQNHLPDGVYYFHFSTEKHNQSGKIILNNL